MPTLQTCVICQQSNELVNSHVVPNFIRRHSLRKNAKIKFQSVLDKRRTVTQDIYKGKLCCRGCEQALSSPETHASKILLELFDNRTDGVLRYGEKFHAFCVGIALKGAALELYNQANEHTLCKMPEGQKTSLKRLIKACRKQLLGRTTSREYVRVWMFSFVDFRNEINTNMAVIEILGTFPAWHKSKFIGMLVVFKGFILLVTNKSTTFSCAKRAIKTSAGQVDFKLNARAPICLVPAVSGFLMKTLEAQMLALLLGTKSSGDIKAP